MKMLAVTFLEAVRWLEERFGVTPSLSRPPTFPAGESARRRHTSSGANTKAIAKPPDTPSGLPLADAVKLVENSQTCLWSSDGQAALAWLRGRGLTDETVRRAHLGWTPGVSVLAKDGITYFRVAGIVIPWMDGERLAKVNVRQLDQRKTKYMAIYHDQPSIYSIGEPIVSTKPLVITEGELDACLLTQALGTLAVVATFGSAAIRPEGATKLAMLPAPVWYLGHDADDAGDKAATGWSARAVPRGRQSSRIGPIRVAPASI